MTDTSKTAKIHLKGDNFQQHIDNCPVVGVMVSDITLIFAVFDVSFSVYHL